MVLPESALQVTFPSRLAASRAFTLTGDTVSIFVPTLDRLPFGVGVTVEVGFCASARQFTLRGVVTSQPTTPAPGGLVSAGVRVSLIDAHRARARQLLAFCAGLPREAEAGLERRIPTRIRCDVHQGQRTVVAEVLDLSPSGAFVAFPRPDTLSAGDRVRLVFDPGRFRWGGEDFTAKVAWTGTRQGTPGFGAQFLGIPRALADDLRPYLEPKPLELP